MKLTFENKIIIFISILASLLEIIDTSIVNVAIPTMMGNLGSTLDQISWVVTGYIIANAIILPMTGWLSKTFGRRSFFTVCIALFTLFSLMCGFAPNLVVLTIFRVFQGLAGGALLPTSQALIQEQFPPEQKGLGGAIFGMGVIVGPTIGPTLGGYLTDQFGWRSIFNINVPLGILATILAWTFVKNANHQPTGAQAQQPLPAGEKAAPDWIGIIFLCLGIGCLQYVLERGHDEDWFQSVSITISFITAAISVPSFIYWELYQAKNPLLDLRLFKDGVLRYGALFMFTLGYMLYGLVFMIPVFAASQMHLSATQIGMLFIPGALATMFMMPIVGNLLRTVDARIFLGAGVILFQICIFNLGHLGSGAGEVDLFWPLMLRGMAFGLLFVPANTLILGQFEGHDLAQVSGLTNLFRQLGGSVGIALLANQLTLNTAQNHADLASHISKISQLADANTASIKVLVATKMSRNLGMGTAQAAGAKIFANRVRGEVTAMSFGQVMLFLMTTATMAYIPVIFIRMRRKVTGPISDH